MVKLSEKKTRLIVRLCLPFHYSEYLSAGGDWILWYIHFLSPALPPFRQVMYQIFSAVEHMHTHNVIHRDLKVGNQRSSFSEWK